jgi:hypothetical protein
MTEGVEFIFMIEQLIAVEHFVLFDCFASLAKYWIATSCFALLAMTEEGWLIATQTSLRSQ